MISYAGHWFDTNRIALGANLRATFTGESLGARIEGGYRIAVAPNLGITPYAAGQAQAFHSGAYGETDVNNAGFGLNYAAKNATDIRSELGARFDLPTLLAGTPFVLRGRFAWAHDFVDTPSLNAAFQALPLSNFTVFGARIAARLRPGVVRRGLVPEPGLEAARQVRRRVCQGLGHLRRYGGAALQLVGFGTQLTADLHVPRFTLIAERGR